MDYNLYRLEIGDKFKIYIDKIKSIYKYKPYKKKYYGKNTWRYNKKDFIEEYEEHKDEIFTIKSFSESRLSAYYDCGETTKSIGISSISLYKTLKEIKREKILNEIL